MNTKPINPGVAQPGAAGSVAGQTVALLRPSAHAQRLELSSMGKRSLCSADQKYKGQRGSLAVSFVSF